MMLFKLSKLVFPMILLVSLNIAWANNDHKNLPLSGYELDIGLNHSPPFVIIDGPFHDLKGIDIDIIRELQRRTGFKIKRNRFHMMGFGNLMDLAAEGKMDIAAGGISITPNRAKIFTQSPGLFRSYQAVIVPTHSDIKSIDDLKGKIIAAETGTNSADILPPDIASTTTIHHEVTTFMTFYAVISGKANALVTEEPMAQALIDNWAKDKLKIVQRIDSSVSDFGYMMKQGSKVSQVLRDELLNMREDGTIANIVQKYLPHYEFPPEHYSYQMRLAAQANQEKQKFNKLEETKDQDLALSEFNN